MSVNKDPATGKWRVQVWYTDWQGNKKKKNKRGFASKREAQAWERDFLGQTHGDAISMPALIEAFNKDMDANVSLGNLKPSTVYNKKNFIRRYIEPYFKNVEAGKVTTAHVNQWLVTLNQSSQRAERMSSGTVNVTRNMLSQIFEYGIQHYGLITNPVRGSKHVKTFTNDKRAKLWSMDEYQTFYQSLTEERHRVIFNALFFSGLRIGELLALTPGDIVGNKILVTKTVSTQGSVEDIMITKPKNDSSERGVVVPEKIIKQLNDYIAQQEGLKTTDQIFDINESTVRSFLTYRAKKLGLPHISPHTLRHSYASHLLAESKDVAMVSHQLGHSSPETTLRYYSFMLPGADTDHVENLNKKVEI